MRSKLFVPGIRPDLFPKAYAGDADAVSFDLEDAVPASRKAEARHAVVAFLATSLPAGNGKRTIVRTNPVNSEYFDADLDALAPLAVDLINLPRIETTEQVFAVVDKLERLEAASPALARTRLLLNIETPVAFRRAAGLAAAHPRVAGLQLGLGDLFEPFGIDRDAPAHLMAVMFPLAMAAAEAGVFVCDGAHPDFNDRAGFDAEARMAQGLGFIGKTCIHPRQVEWANEVFTPAPEQIDWARRVVAASQEAAVAGQAVFVVDGRMVDAPYLRRAERVLQQAGDVRPEENRGA